MRQNGGKSSKKTGNEMSGDTISKSCVLPSLIGYLLGGHVMRLFHGHDEVVAIPGSDQSEEQQRCETCRALNKVDYTAALGVTLQ